ncbi:Mvb12 ESCRT-I complex subunit [Candida orthopsilosis Co 90-125]|uniref:Mvb12 ESCRT-I complex subunit n=1 Tax=Candida orthopsilosis (strain 90-125) TaxID=1136231 RepID=H8X613_CANO9|nr:Mvb12 ESCRT-I complex subunit [Candida orthopsilosis Co 90-125]CCG23261.1 Mvb12 ESCRT-I complex subunit [Candida orthopsilosis Co 90-125]
MDDTDKPDPILKQVPLIKNPSYQPPKAISLRTNYSKLLPTLSHTVVPPNLNITKEDIDKWSNEIDEYKTMIANEQKTDSSVVNYEKWIKEQSTKVAPGFDYDILTPKK